jgi:hypothetical protein
MTVSRPSGMPAHPARSEVSRPFRTIDSTPMVCSRSMPMPAPHTSANGFGDADTIHGSMPAAFSVATRSRICG